MTATTQPPHPSRQALSATLSLPAMPACVSWCRGAVGAVMDAWGVETAARDASLLIVSELVANAVRHGRGPITVQLELDRWEGALVGTVEDAGPGWPTPADGDPAALVEGGRGLLLVGELATRWGVTRCAGAPGKRVWWCLAVPYLGLEVLW